MKMLLTWNTQMKLGIAALDNQHKQLIDLLNQLNNAVLLSDNNLLIKRAFNCLVDFIEQHTDYEASLFAKENKVLVNTEQLALNNHFFAKIASIQADLQQGANIITPDLVRFVAHRIAHHINHDDKKQIALLTTPLQLNEKTNLPSSSCLTANTLVAGEHLNSVLYETETRFKDLAENISALIWITNKEHLPIFCNQFWYQCFQLTPNEVTRKNWQHKIHPEDRERVLHTYLQAAQNKTKLILEYRLLNEAHHERWIVETTMPRLTITGEFLGLMGCGMDITAQKQANQQLQQTNHQLNQAITRQEHALQATLTRLENNEELQLQLDLQLKEAQSLLLQAGKMASIGQLVAGVAHEINNPLGYINSNLASLKEYIESMTPLFALVDNLLEALPSNHPAVNAYQQFAKEINLTYIREDVEDLVRESIEGAIRTKKIVQDLRDFSHYEQPEWALFDIEAGLDASLNIANNELKYKAAIFKQYAGLEPLLCLGSQLNQVFLNLLINAAQAIEEKGDIYLRTGRLLADWVWIEIEDTGVGIPEEIQKKIFEPFFTTKPMGKGTGLGLSLSMHIVQLHQGRIEVMSTVHKGTRFRVYLPINTSPPR
ncbi:MAG: PAS domain-containing protein [Methylovulum sp.]|nr:PAS domain-containing protein [Methylovulum sp.]